MPSSSATPWGRTRDDVGNAQPGLPSGILEVLREHEFKQIVREELVGKLMKTLGEIISREKQLKDIGGTGSKLSLRFKRDWQENEVR